MNDNLYNDSKIKIFVGYSKKNFIFHSDVYQPILTSSIDWEDSNEVIKDSDGINISKKNKNYAELTGHYWVWKNFIPKTSAEYIGFCHYRRFLDFNLNQTEKFPFKPVLGEDFKKVFNHYTQEKILSIIDGYDIILPYKFHMEANIYDQYLIHHPQKDLDSALEVLEKLYPDYADDANEFMKSDNFYSCLNFIMKKELLNEYMEWIFNILKELEQKTSWVKYNEYKTVRVPAFLAERFFNIWLMHNIREKSLKVLESTSFILVGEEYSPDDYSSPEVSMARYMVEFQFYQCRLLQRQLAQLQSNNSK